LISAHIALTPINNHFVIRSFVFLGFAFLALVHPYPAPNVKIAERSAIEEAGLAEADSVTPPASQPTLTGSN
jgi:hypothetical protein